VRTGAGKANRLVMDRAVLIAAHHQATGKAAILCAARRGMGCWCPHPLQVVLVWLSSWTSRTFEDEAPLVGESICTKTESPQSLYTARWSAF
jgi:hypothetical protein